MGAPVKMDLSDVDPRVGVPVGGGEPWEPVAATDVRRWVMAMDYPNPLHWDEEFARASRFGRLVAPQSFAAAMDYVHGVRPSLVGRIPGSHMIFGGEEWWFHGPRIFPGDRLDHERVFKGYKLAQTKFAGETMFSWGDTIHRNQRGESVATARSTSVRYLAEEARKRGFYGQTAPAPTWTQDALAIACQGASRLDGRYGVVDAGICHGAAGLGHLYNRLFQATGHDVFRATARAWFERTLAMRQPDAGIAGFLTLIGLPDSWGADSSFLTGVNGIALALLAAATPCVPAWDGRILAKLPVRP